MTSNCIELILVDFYFLKVVKDKILMLLRESGSGAPKKKVLSILSHEVVRNTVKNGDDMRNYI